MGSAQYVVHIHFKYVLLGLHVFSRKLLRSPAIVCHSSFFVAWFISVYSQGAGRKQELIAIMEDEDRGSSLHPESKNEEQANEIEDSELSDNSRDDEFSKRCGTEELSEPNGNVDESERESLNEVDILELHRLKNRQRQKVPDAVGLVRFRDRLEQSGKQPFDSHEPQVMLLSIFKLRIPSHFLLVYGTDLLAGYDRRTRRCQ